MIFTAAPSPQCPPQEYLLNYTFKIHLQAFLFYCQARKCDALVILNEHVVFILNQ